MDTDSQTPLDFLLAIAYAEYTLLANLEIAAKAVIPKPDFPRSMRAPQPVQLIDVVGHLPDGRTIGQYDGKQVLLERIDPASL